MMREPVVIVLNEREPAKMRAAEDLQAALSQYGITASRIEITEDIIELLKSRHPKVLVLDYLLGDYSTGPDIMTAFETVKQERRPRVFYLTDEPSVQVAVNALRMGALNYYELDSADSIKRLAAEIDHTLREGKASPKRTPLPALSLDELVAQSAQSRKLIEQAKAIITRGAPIIVVKGPCGSGISTVARAIERSSNSSAFRLIADMRFNSSSIEELIGLYLRKGAHLSLGENLFLIAEYADQDGGELLDCVYRNLSRLWPDNRASSSGSRLVICTADEETAQAWKRMTRAELLCVAPLKERSEDIAPLVQRFAKEAEDLIGKKIKPLPSDVIEWLSSLEWKANVRELRSCVLDALLSSVYSDTPIRQLLEESRCFAEGCFSEDAALTVDPLIAAAMLEKNGWSYRVAAAKLGISINALYSSLHSAEHAK
ncbi:MAG: hypothetical protein J5J00_15155 [Deltaproteobacteria bacterium]|nr:hypothetical protein [Deltaproteobacteria bacterium]